MLNAGTRLGDRYVLLESIARGGMGEVWRADDTVLGRVVAVKILLPTLSGDPGFAERFRTEARAMAALSDPNIVEVYDYGQVEELAYLVMQLVPGEPLYLLLRRVGSLPPHQVMNLVAQAARALNQAHSQGIVHRDVKPGNLLIRPDGRLVLTDFGIARIVAADRLTAAGEIMGTASYLAPEQVTGEPVGPATDVYALGVVAYECLTLTLPFVADTPIAVALMHARDEPPPLPTAVPEPVRHVVMRALAKDPRRRWPSAAAMAQAASAAAAAVAGSLPVRVSPDLRPPAPISPPASSRLTSSRLTSSRLTSSRLTSSRLPTQPVARPEPRRRRLAWVAAAVVLLLAAVGWAVLDSTTRDGVEAAASSPPPATSSSADTASPSPSATATSVAPSPLDTATPQPASGGPGPAPATRSSTSTAPPSPGPNERVVPNVLGQYEMSADYAIRAAGLVPQFIHVSSPTQCYVIDQTPGPNTIVAVNSTVKVTVAISSATCQPA